MQKKAPAEAEAYIIETLKELKMSEFPIAKQVDNIQTLQLLRDYAGHFANLV